MLVRMLDYSVSIESHMVKRLGRHVVMALTHSPRAVAWIMIFALVVTSIYFQRQVTRAALVLRLMNLKSVHLVRMFTV